MCKCDPRTRTPFCQKCEPITVCDKCLQASCWQGILLCDDAQTAGTTTRTRSELAKLNFEHPSYWKTDAEVQAGSEPQAPGQPPRDEKLSAECQMLREQLSALQDKMVTLADLHANAATAHAIAALAGARARRFRERAEAAEADLAALRSAGVTAGALVALQDERDTASALLQRVVWNYGEPMPTTLPDTHLIDDIRKHLATAPRSAPAVDAPAKPHPEPIAAPRPAQAPRPGLTAAELVDALQQETVVLVVRCSTVAATLAVIGAAGTENVAVWSGAQG